MKASVNHVMYVGRTIAAGALPASSGRSAGVSIDANPPSPSASRQTRPRPSSGRGKRPARRSGAECGAHAFVGCAHESRDRRSRHEPGGAGSCSHAPGAPAYPLASPRRATPRLRRMVDPGTDERAAPIRPTRRRPAPAAPEQAKHRNPWIWISAVLALVAVGVTIWALGVKSDNDQAKDELEAPSRSSPARKSSSRRRSRSPRRPRPPSPRTTRAAGRAALTVGAVAAVKALIDDLEADLGATQQDLEATEQDLEADGEAGGGGRPEGGQGREAGEAGR